MCVVQDRLKRATVGPLPGVTQDIAGFKVKPYFCSLSICLWNFFFVLFCFVFETRQGEFCCNRLLIDLAYMF